MPKSAMPMKKKATPNSVNSPPSSGPMNRRRAARITTSSAEARDTTMPNIEKSCRGTTEKPVMRSKFSRMSR